MRYNRGYTLYMKTAISIPDGLFKNAQRIAEKLGISRSQLFALAVKEFIENHGKNKITEKLNQIYSEQENSSNSFLEDIGIETIRKTTHNDTW